MSLMRSNTILRDQAAMALDTRSRIKDEETKEDKETIEAEVNTTDATVTTLYTFTLPASTDIGIEVRVVARRTGGSGGTAEDGAYYILNALYKMVSGTTATIIGSVVQTVVGESQVAWDATLDTTGTTVRVRVTGATNNNVTWRMWAKVYPVST
jgi:hypothetical protein